MTYTWNKKELLKLKELVRSTRKDEEDEILLDEMIGIVDNTPDLYSLDITPSEVEFDFSEASSNFKYHLNRYPEWLFDSLSSLFKTVDNYRYFCRPNIVSAIDTTIDEILEMAYDCLKELNNKDVLNYFDKLRDTNNHMLHITNKIDMEGKQSIICGLTYNLNINKKQYLFVFEDDSYIFFQAFLHEFMHAYFKSKDLKSLKRCYLNELEGHYGDRLAIEYLYTHGLTKYAKELELNDNKGIFKASYNLYMSDLLYGTHIGNQFDVKSAKKIYEEELNKPWKFTKKSIEIFASTFGENTAKNIFDYLIFNDLRSKYSMEEIFKYMPRMFKEDNLKFIDKLDKFGITFHKDGYQNVRKQTERIRGRK